MQKKRNKHTQREKYTNSSRRLLRAIKICNTREYRWHLFSHSMWFCEEIKKQQFFLMNFNSFFFFFFALAQHETISGWEIIRKRVNLSKNEVKQYAFEHDIHWELKTKANTNEAHDISQNTIDCPFFLFFLFFGEKREICIDEKSQTKFFPSINNYINENDTETVINYMLTDNVPNADVVCCFFLSSLMLFCLLFIRFRYW